MEASIFAALLVVGLMLIGAEIFVPGGVLGVFGSLFLAAAVIAAFAAFPAHVAILITIGIFLLLAGVIFLWARFFPNTKIGRKMTLAADTRGYKATEEGLAELLGKDGVAKTDLRPAGIAAIGGRRTDVVTEGGMVSAGEKVLVVDVAGNRVVVRKKDK